MKMLGDAATEAVRSWLETSAPQEALSDPCEPTCEASTSGSPPHEDLLTFDSAEDIARAVRRPRAPPLLGPPLGLPLGLALRPAGSTPAGPAAQSVIVQPQPQPDDEADKLAASPSRPLPPLASSGPGVSPAALEGSAAPYATSSPPAATPAPAPGPRPSSVEKLDIDGVPDSASANPPRSLKDGEENDDSQGAWAQSCVEFELQLEAAETKVGAGAKRQVLSRAPKKISESCDDVLHTCDVKDSVRNAQKKTIHILKDQIVSNLDQNLKKKRKSSRNEPFQKTIRKCSHRSKSRDLDSLLTSFGPSHPVSESEEKSQSNVKTRSSKTGCITVNKFPSKETELESDTCPRNGSSVMNISKKSSKKTKSSLHQEDLCDKHDIKNEPRSPDSLGAKKDTADSPLHEILNSATTNKVKSIKIRLRTKIVEIEQSYCLRPKGDGSDFRPGWQEEVCQYKRSLRMPSILINASKFSHVDGECPKTSSVCSTSESNLDSSANRKFSQPNSEIDSSSVCPDDDAASSVSLSTSTISRGGKRSSIVDKLVEKVSRVSACKKQAEIRGNSASKSSQALNVDRHQTKQSGKNDMILASFKGNDKISNVDCKAQDSVKSVFGVDKSLSPISKSRRVEENKKGKSKSLLPKRKSENVPVRQISLRKRNLVIPKPSSRKNLGGTDSGFLDGIVLRPRNVQLSSTRPGLRSAALVRRSKVVLNSKIRKVKKGETRQSSEQLKTFSLNTDAGDEGDGSPNTSSMKSSQPNVVRRRVKVRRKFRSGFDYIRKKKRVRKELPKSEGGDKVKAPVKVLPEVERTMMTEEQIQALIRNWFVNRSHGDTVLHRAARLGYPEVAQYAIEKLKISPCVSDNAGFTPLHEAARRGHVHLSKILLENGADASCSAKGGVRPLHEAAESNEVEMLRLLLEYGADPTVATYANKTALSIVDPNTEAHHLLTLHLADIQGLPAPPWRFAGPCKIFDPVTYKGDLALESPPSTLNGDGDGDSEIDIFSSEVMQPPLYKLCIESSSQLWVLEKDLMKALNISTETELMHFLESSMDSISDASNSFNSSTRIKEISADEFLQETKPITFLASETHSSTSGGVIRLVEYSDKVQTLLSEEVTPIS